MSRSESKQLTESLSVLLPTWKRPESLARCLRALARQTRRAEQIVVTVRREDHTTLDAIASLQHEIGPALQVVLTPAVNLRDAMNLGLAQTTGSLVALTDDDAEPHDDWLAKLEAAFTSPAIVGVGGRDWQPHERGSKPVVGTLAWFGRTVGNHHLGVGPARRVQLLKGVNCCFRGDPLRRIGFDRRLRGQGNVSHWELALCLALLREGGELVYDPAIGVDHHVGPRHDGDINARGGFDRASYIDGVHNEVLVIAEHLSLPRRWVYRLWQFTIGTSATPGVLQTLRRWLNGGASLGSAIDRFRAVRAGVRLAKDAARMSALPSTVGGDVACAPRR